ncbi:MAG: MEDS domain-containing protein [Acidobacteriota bacterium]
MDPMPVDDILLAATCPYHINMIYRSEGSMASSAGLFLHAAVVRGGTAIAIATASHHEALDGELSGQGLDLAALKRQGRYIALDAESVDDRFTQGGRFHAKRTESFGADLLHRANAAGGPVSLFGEVAGLFVQRKDRQGAMDLEDLWDRLLVERPHRALCGYPGSAFTGSTGRRDLKAFCDRHAHTIGRGA